MNVNRDLENETANSQCANNKQVSEYVLCKITPTLWGPLQV